MPPGALDSIERRDQAGDVHRPGRLAHLVGDDVDGVALGGQPQHGAREVRAARARRARRCARCRGWGGRRAPVARPRPWCGRRRRADAAARPRGRARRPCRRTRSRWRAWTNWRPGGGGRARRVLRADGVDRRCASSSWVSASSTRVYAAALTTTSTPRAAASTAAASRMSSSALVGAVDLAAERATQIGAEHPGAAEQERAHQASAARALSGSHQSRLSRYHCTTSASPCSNGTSGS